VVEDPALSRAIPKYNDKLFVKLYLLRFPDNDILGIKLSKVYYSPQEQ
jgi:hypothetical protein